MKLQLNEKWKWLAMDESGEWCMYSSAPHRDLDDWDGDSCRVVTRTFDFSWYKGDWKDSLHEILPDGTLRKLMPELEVDTLVMVRISMEDGYVPRYFSRFTEDGRIRYFTNGRTSKTTNDTLISSDWRLPEEGEV